MLAARMGREDVVGLLLAHGASSARLDIARFFHAVDSGDDEAVRRMVRAGVDVNARDQGWPKSTTEGRTALVDVSWTEDNEMLETLLEVGADPNLGDEMQRVPLWAAIQRGDAVTVKRLLDRGARLDVVDWSGTSLLDRARQRENAEIIRLLEERMR